MKEYIGSSGNKESESYVGKVDEWEAAANDRSVMYIFSILAKE